MFYSAYRGYCLASTDETNLPGKAVPAPFSPLVLLCPGDPIDGRCLTPIAHLGELGQRGVRCLTPAPPVSGTLAGFVEKHGALGLNPRFRRCWELLEHRTELPKTGLRVSLVGLGDVGATALLALVLLGQELKEIQLYDRNEALCQRYALEMNQLSSPDGRPLPRVRACREDELFPCDLFLFAATRGVPPVGTTGDVRMLQLEANRPIVAHYAKKARESQFRGLFCQISDPVDQLCRVAFLESNRNDQGEYDFLGLLPEQIQGFGLGVMATRAAFTARELGLPEAPLRVYGPHGAGLVCANAPGEGYDDRLSRQLTEATVNMNHRVRALGFKPYIAPGVSSAAVSILRMVRGEAYYGAVALDGVYFGCRVRRGRWGVEVLREELDERLLNRIGVAYDLLQEAI